MLVIVQGKKFDLNDNTLPKDGYLDVILHTQVSTDKIDGYHVLDMEIDDFEEYYKFLQFRTDFELREELFDYMGHFNVLKYPNEFWRIKLIDDRIREFWYHSDKDKNIHKNIDMIQLALPLDTTETRIRDVLRHIPNGKLPKDHYIAGGAALYIAGITDVFKDIDIFTCNKNETMRYIQSSYGPHNYYGMYQSGNAITIKGKVSVQFITREYSSPSQIIHGFDVSCCSILFDGNKLWTTNKGLYCINNMVNWFEPDRSSPTYALRLCKYHMRGFMLRLPSTEGLTLNVEYYNSNKDKIMKKYYHEYCNEIDVSEGFDEISRRIYINPEHFLDEYEKYGGDISKLRQLKLLLGDARKSVDPEELINALEDPKNGDKTYEKIVKYVIDNTQSIKYDDLMDAYHEEYISQYDIFTVSYAQIHTSGDINANPIAASMSLLNKITMEYEWPNDPMSIMISTSILGIHPRLIGEKSQRYKSNISDYEDGKITVIKNVSNIQWYTGNPMEQGLTGTFYPEPIMEDVRDFYLSSPLVKVMNVGNVSLEPRRWYRKR